MTIGVVTVNVMLDTALDGSRWLNVTTDVGDEACPRQVVTYAAAINGRQPVENGGLDAELAGNVVPGRVLDPKIDLNVLNGIGSVAVGDFQGSLER